MDNLTHSVVGLGIGALIDRSLPAEPDQDRQRTRTRMLLVIACLASNFPDLDLVLTGLLDPPLGYLLHHRGHTHTLVFALLEFVLLLAPVYLFWPAARRLQQVSGPGPWGACLAAGAGLLLHIGMDSLNVYGVHPFWPFDPNWYYGSLFQTPLGYISVSLQGLLARLTFHVIPTELHPLSSSATTSTRQSSNTAVH